MASPLHEQRAELGHGGVVAAARQPHLSDGCTDLVMTRAGLMVRVRCHLHDWKALRATTADLDCPGCVAAEQIARDRALYDWLI